MCNCMCVGLCHVLSILYMKYLMSRGREKMWEAGQCRISAGYHQQRATMSQQIPSFCMRPVCILCYNPIQLINGEHFVSFC